MDGSFTGNMNNTEVKKTPTGKGNFKNTAYSLSKSTSSNDNEVAGKFKIKCPICQEVPAMNNKSDGKSFRYFTKKNTISQKFLKCPAQKTRIIK